jgi:hypothetical protein
MMISAWFCVRVKNICLRKSVMFSARICFFSHGCIVDQKRWFLHVDNVFRFQHVCRLSGKCTVSVKNVGFSKADKRCGSKRLDCVVVPNIVFHMAGMCDGHKCCLRHSWN